MRRAPGQIRDAIIAVLRRKRGDATIAEIRAGVEQQLGESVAPSSVRSYLRLNTSDLFEHVGRGQYRLRQK